MLLDNCNQDQIADVTILGAGVAGISASYHLSLKGISTICYEKNSRPGGLLSGFEINGFRFDNAVHLSFTTDPYVRSIFDKVEYLSHRPNAYCFERGRWLKHPVQNNLWSLSTDDKVSLIDSFFSRPNFECNNYDDWLKCQYGNMIAERYPIKYTKKYWGISAENLSLSWIGNRLRTADSKEILRGAFEKREDNHYYASEMRYPTRGGYYAFIEGMINLNRVELSKDVLSICLNKRLITFTDGCVVSYKRLISSLPLPRIIEVIENVPKQIKEAAKKLLYTKIDLISVGFSRKDIPPYLWFYIYDGAYAARAYSPSFKSPENVPDGCSSLQFEIYTLSTNECQDKEVLIADIKNFLIDNNICIKEDIIFVHHKHLEFGNVVFNIGMEERRDVVINYLQENNIISCGRFGEWDYLWSDQALISGKNAAEKIIDTIDGE